MNNRIVASLVVFGVGFGVGLGTTWALLAKRPAPPVEEDALGPDGLEPADGGAAAPVGLRVAPAEPPAAAPGPGAAAEGAQPAAAAEGAQPAAAAEGAQPAAAAEGAPPAAEGGEPTAEGGEPVAEGGAPVAEGGAPAAEGGEGAAPTAEGGEPVAEGGAPVAEGGAPTAEGGEPVAEGGAPTAEGGEPAGAEGGGPVAAGGEPGAADPKAAPANWWEGLVGKRCKVDLGRVKVLTVRQGTLKDGEVLDWKSRFASKDPVGRLFQEQDNLVTVLGVATDTVGNPVAAKVEFDRQGKTITGVIALHTQGLRVSLHPVGGGSP